MTQPTTPGTGTENVTWQRPSIRIRRPPSNNAIPRARAATINAAGHPRAGSGGNGEEQDTRHTANISARDSGGYFTTNAPSSSGTRPRSGSGSTRQADRGVNHDGGRRRSSSDPARRSWEPPHATHSRGAGVHGGTQMPVVQEGDAATDVPERPPATVLPVGDASQVNEDARGNSGVGRRLGNAWQVSTRFLPTLGRTNNAQDDDTESQYESDLVNVLDTIDPEISTLNTLTNVQNSLFVPDLGRLLNRRPTYTLTRHASQGTFAGILQEKPEIEEAEEGVIGDVERLERRQTTASLTSNMDANHFAVLPHGEKLEGWSAADRAELNDHVRHMLHSKREKIKRGWKGFGQYVRKPLGFLVTLYAVLITLFGTAWVLFLIGWINLGNRKDYIVNVVDNVLVALFAIMGDGLAPFRAVDTYHMCFIAHYHHLTWRLRKEQSLPKLQNHNDLPPLEQTQELESDVDVEGQEKPRTESSVLNPNQQKRLEHHQKKFARSHTFYKPHETTTHFAFPLRILVAVVVLLDCHSLLQISLGACTWGIDYRVRPFALTTVILCCSLTCNITAGILISIGDKRTRKKDVLERMFRQELTAQAIEKLQKRHQKEKERNEILEVPGVGTDLATPIQADNDVQDNAAQTSKVTAASGS